MPLSVLHEYVKEVEEICTHYHIPVAWFGHALDGNLHTMLMLGENGQTENDTRVKKAIHEIYTYAIGNGGVISGEHGIGMLQKEFMPLQFSRPHLDLMQGIKHLFDPNDILNPGKIL
jgi:glycolate oxidase